MCHQEFIFEEQGLLEISKNKNPSKIMRYTVYPNMSEISLLLPKSGEKLRTMVNN